MTKTMTCDKCNGRGYFDFPQYGADWAGVTVLRCEVCQGKGTVDVPITNADHIRSMTDEELAKWLEEVDCWNCDCCVYQRECRLEYDEEKHDCADGRMNWLKQPWKETT